MGAPSDTDSNRSTDDDAVDDGWTADSPVHNDRTTAGLYVDPASVGKLTAGKHPIATTRDNDRTATGLEVEPPAIEQLALDTEPSARALNEDSAVTALDQTLATLDIPDAGADNSSTKLGLGVVAPPARPAFVLLDPDKGPVHLDKDRELVQPERSPLDLVMREADLAAAPKAAHSSGDSSRFIATLVGNQPPPQIAADVSAITPIQPVLRRPGARRKWIVAGALAATAVIGTAFAMTTRKDEPRTSASEAAKVSEPATPQVAGLAATPNKIAMPAAAPDPSEVAAPADPTVAPPADPTVAPPADPTVAAATTAEPTKPAPTAKLETVAVAKTSETAAKREAPSAADEKPATARKTVALKEAAPKAEKSTTKTTTTKATATAKPSTAKKTVATKEPTAKKSPAAKTSTAKPTTAKPTTAKKTVATKEAAKKSSTAKKPVPAKKTASTADKKAAAKKAPAPKKPADKTPAKKTTTAKKPTAKKT